MPTLSQRNFSSGEVTPSLYARTDIAQYMTGLRTLKNFFVKKHGGAQNRPGTKYVCSVKTAGKKIKFIPFVFNASQTYMLEFGDQYMRVIQNGARLESSPGVPYEITTPYLEADLPTLNYNQSGDVITLTHPSYAVRELARSGHTTWTLTAVTFAPSISTPTGLASNAAGTAAYYVVTAVKAETYEESLPCDPVGSSSETSTLTWTAVAGAQEYNVYKKKAGVYGFIGVASNPTFTDATISADTADTPPNKRNPFAVTPIATVSIHTAGSSYVVGDILTITQTGGSSGKVRVDSLSGSGVAAVSIVDYGQGYAVANELATTGGTGTGCKINILTVTTNNFPATSSYYQQRQLFGNINSDTEKVWGSKSANFKNLSVSSPSQDDDAVTFPVRGRQVNSVKHMINLGKLIVLTEGAEWVVNGDQSGILRAGEVNPVEQSYNGCSFLRPIIINDTALYVQARQNIVRDLKYQIGADGSDGYQGTDITIMSTHLFEEFTLMDWAFTQTPNPIAWIVRSDGVLLGLTYLREHKIFAWHRHEFQDGEVESVGAIPEGTEDVLYLCIKRTINGSVVRYIEKMTSRLVRDIKDAIFMDSALTYDGRNTGATTMALTTGAGWTHDDSLTLTASAGFFASGDVGNEIHITGTDGDILRCQITAYASATEVTVTPHKTVPAGMRTGSTTNWAKAVDEISGLGHLEGENLSIMGDGFVVASPNNESYVVKTVASGVVSLDKCYAVIHAGLPYISDLETLDIDNPNGETVSDKKKIVTGVTVYVEASRGLWAGSKPPTDDDTDPLEGLYEPKARNAEGYDDPVDLKTGQVDIPIKAEWNANGRVFLRQVDPLPVNILAVFPKVLAPFK